MTLFHREQDETGIRFVALSPEAEAAARADATNLFGNDSGYEILLSPTQAAAIREQWAVNDALDNIKARRCAAAMERRAVAIDGGLSFGGMRFQTGPDDRENVAGAAQLAALAIMAGAQAGDLRWHGGETDFVWIAGDNSLAPMDAPTVIAFGKAVAARKSACIFHARALKDAITAAADRAALDAIDIEAGWPAD